MFIFGLACFMLRGKGCEALRDRMGQTFPGSAPGRGAAARQMYSPVDARRIGGSYVPPQLSI